MNKKSATTTKAAPATKTSSPKTNGTATATASRSSETKARPTFSTMTAANKGKAKTRVVIKYDVGFANALYLRGQGANLSWDKGTPLKNVSANEWVWETDLPFAKCEFKVLINDSQYESGENHQIRSGATIDYIPSFA